MKRKVYTFINIFGLATGMAVCLLIVLFIQDELGYDNFQQNGDRIYRVVLDRRYPGRSTSYSFIPQSIAPAIKQEFPEVEKATRLFSFLGNGTFLVKIGDKVFEEKNVLGADSNFFSVFAVKMLAGNAATALQKPNTVVVTESAAKKYFGSVANAIGKQFETDNNTQLLVAGVCNDWPQNSHFAFDILLASAGFDNLKRPDYTGFSAHTYLLLNKNAQPKQLEAKLPLIIEKYVSGDIQQSFGVSWKQFQAAGNGYHYYLQPLTKIHLTSDLEGELKANGSMNTIYIFSVIAAFILAIACINFINLSTARSVERAKEVGIRKTFGSEKKSLIWQFLFESTLISFLSMILAAAMIVLLLPFFNKVSGKELSVAYFTSPLNIALLISFVLLIGLVAGLYPAFVLSSFKPILVLKGKFKASSYGMALRNGLVVFQFAISVILIICTITVNRQMQYITGDILGFKKEHIIEIERTEILGKKSKAFGDELSKIPGVEDVSGASALPGTGNFFGVTFQELGSKEPMTGRGVIADAQLVQMLGLQMKEGRFFNKQFMTDTLAIVLNEKAVEELGLKTPLGARLTTTNGDFNAPGGAPYIYTVVGVLKDFHFQSLHQKIAPLVIVNAARFNNINALTAVKIKGDNFKAALDAVALTWRQFVPEHPFHYSFLDQSLANQYQAEQTTQRVFTVFSVLAIFIACIGLFGLAAYSTQQRLKEISIRKVLGAGVANIIGMLSKDFLKLVLISAVVAFPIAWWAMHAWLQNFEYRVDMAWWVFLVAGALSAFIALATISWQAIKAAFVNPVKSLRAE